MTASMRPLRAAACAGVSPTWLAASNLTPSVKPPADLGNGANRRGIAAGRNEMCRCPAAQVGRIIAAAGRCDGPDRVGISADGGLLGRRALREMCVVEWSAGSGDQTDEAGAARRRDEAGRRIDGTILEVQSGAELDQSLDDARVSAAQGHPHDLGIARKGRIQVVAQVGGGNQPQGCRSGLRPAHLA
jgi:hypothetical protein